MPLRDIGDPKYIALETFRKNGKAVNTPVWAVWKGDDLLVGTPRDSWKVKRIRNNPRVRVAPSDARGNPKGPWVEARAEISEDPALLQELDRLRKRKYPIAARLIGLALALRRRNSPLVALIIRDADEAPSTSA